MDSRRIATEVFLSRRKPGRFTVFPGVSGGLKGGGCFSSKPDTAKISREVVPAVKKANPVVQKASPAVKKASPAVQKASPILQYFENELSALATVPLNAIEVPFNSTHDLQELLTYFIKSHKTVCLLTGNPGTGKTFAVKLFALNLLKQKSGFNPVYIYMPAMKIYENKAANEAVLQYGFAHNSNLLYIFDGVNKENARFVDFTQGKSIVVSRSDEDYVKEHCFKNSQSIYHIEVQDVSQETAYDLVMKIADAKKWSIKDHIWDLLKKIPNVFSVISNPLMTSLMLSDLSVLYAVESKHNNISRYKICQEYVNFVQKSAATYSETISYQHTQDMEKFHSLCTSECTKLAFKALRGASIQETQLNSELIEAFPIKQINFDNKFRLYDFSKPLITEYFVANAILSIIKESKENIESTERSELNKELFTENDSLVSLIAESLEENDKKNLLSIVMYSKYSSKVTVAAANSISILARSGYNFRGKNLDGIKINGANLKSSNFSGARLKRSDLRNTNFSNSCLISADMSWANLANAKFGQFPILRGHSAWVNSIRMQGDLLVSASLDCTAKIWDLKTGEDVFTLEAHLDAVTCVDILNSFIVTGSADNSLIIWSTSGQKIRTLEGHSEAILTVSFSSDGETIISGSNDGFVIVWDFYKQIKKINAHSAAVNCLKVSYNNKILLTGSNDRTVKVWDFKTGKMLKTFEGHSGEVKSVAISHKLKYAVSAGTDRSIYIWDLNSGEVIETLDGHVDWVNSVEISPDERLIISGSADGTVKMWGNSDVKTLRGHFEGVSCVAFSQDYRQIASAGEDASIRLWDIEEPEKTVLKSCAMTNDCKYIVTAGDSITVWDLEGSSHVNIKGHVGKVNSVCLSSNDKLLASGGDDMSARVWNFPDKTPSLMLFGHTQKVLSVKFTPENAFLLSASADETIKKWSLESGDLIMTFRGHSGAVNSLGVSPIGSRAVSGSDDRSIKIWNVNTGNALKTLQNTFRITCVDFSGDGKLVIYASWDRFVTVWSVETEEEVLKIEETSVILSVCFAPDSKTFATGGTDGIVKVRNIGIGDEKTVLQSHFKDIFAVNMNNKFLVSVSDSAKVWDLDIEGHTLVSDYEIVYSKDASILGNVSKGKITECWDLDTGDPVNIDQTLFDMNKVVGEFCETPVIPIYWSSANQLNCSNIKIDHALMDPKTFRLLSDLKYTIN